MNLAQLLAKSAAIFAQRPAISLGTELVADYATLADRAGRLAAGLTGQAGLVAGDRVALVMTNAPSFYEILFAVWQAGLAAVPVNAKLHPRETAYILEQSGSRLAFVSQDLAEGLAPHAGDTRLVVAGRHDALLADRPAPMAEVAPDDLAWLFYTSGTTGRPKGAMLSHRNLLAMVMNYFADVDQVAETDTMIHAAPLSHGSGLYGLAHIAKAANNVIPESGGFEPAETLKLIAAWSGASFFFAPTMLTRLINSPALADADTGNLKTIVYGGGPMYRADLVRALELLGPKLVQIYGLGESPMTISGLRRTMHLDDGHPRYLDRLASAGPARTDMEVRVVDGDDRPLPAGEVGEVICRGDPVMLGYWQNPEATSETLRGGWLHTGDMGSFDADGYLTLKDRSKDMIISGGTNIYPREVEDALLTDSRVAEAAVVGRPHPDWGEEVIAFIVARPDAAPTEAELDAVCLDRIARFKRPKAYRFVEALPKNNYGKVLKTELRARLAEEA